MQFISASIGKFIVQLYVNYNTTITRKTILSRRVTKEQRFFLFLRKAVIDMVGYRNKNSDHCYNIE